MYHSGPYPFIFSKMNERNVGMPIWIAEEIETIVKVVMVSPANDLNTVSPLDVRLIKDSTGAVIQFSGSWQKALYDDKKALILKSLESLEGVLKKILVDTHGVHHWDSTLPAFLLDISRELESRGLELDISSIDPGIARLFRLAKGVVPHASRKKGEYRKGGILERFGVAAYLQWGSFLAATSFIGESTVAFFRLIKGKARFRRADFTEQLFLCGAQALPIVSLISVLVGLILAFIGAIQLRQFGAQIYIANLVGIAMAREMGAVMVGVIMSGRTGAAFAAQLGTMEGNEEIDALKTLGISPVEFLVVPRMLALILMMPLLAVYALAAGIGGGILVSFFALDISPAAYLTQTSLAVVLRDLWIGITKSICFGVLIALCSCYQGMRSGRNASAVGNAATAAVVNSIVSIVITDAVFAVLCNIMGI